MKRACKSLDFAQRGMKSLVFSQLTKSSRVLSGLFKNNYFQMKYLSVLLAFTVLILSASCRTNVLRGEGNKTTRSSSVSSFNAVQIDVSLKAIINVQEGATAGVQLSGYENVLEHIKTKIVNNTLKIYSDLDETWELKTDDLTAIITVPSIALLKLSGATDADIHGNVTGSSFRLGMSGACNVKIDGITADDFTVDASGASDLTVKGGTVKRASYDLSGASKVKAYPLQTNETVASISGAGTGHVTALQKLSASISGAGTIKYKGHPSVSQDISGAGSISDAN
jgi:hypothetical protein